MWNLCFLFREIASAIKKLLDAVNEVSTYTPGQGKQALEQRKREFVKYSKRFSNTLKEYFKEGQLVFFCFKYIFKTLYKNFKLLSFGFLLYFGLTIKVIVLQLLMKILKRKLYWNWCSFTFEMSNYFIFFFQS